ncbi:MAG: SDR family oxidoreductase [Clostridia bacterium]|nr:SDR family oxidoreductase [Clostridia bacterium]
MKLKNKVALVTGAAVGIGRATAIKMAQEGAHVVALDLNGEGLEKLRREIEALPGRVLPLVCDVSDEAAVNTAFAKAKETFGKIDILVNNAALWRSKTAFMDTPVEEWKRYLDVNVMSVVYCTRAALPDMLEEGYGRIINVASVAGVYGNAKMVHYSATKGALISMTRALAKEVSGKGVLVNCVSPGSVSPSEEDDLNYSQPSELSFMGRTGSTMENANLICFLASDDATYISGQNIQIDGCRKKQ